MTGADGTTAAQTGIERGSPVVRPAGAAGGVALLALLLYLRTLLPGLAFGDWGEMQTVPHVLGVAHPTGYPTYVLLARLFELLPVGSVAFRANLLSAVCVAATLGVLALVAHRLGARPPIAAAAALATGVIGTVWAAATVAEVNSLHLLLIVLLVDRALAWEADRRPRDLALGGLLIGLSLGNHLLTLSVAPFLVLFVLWAGRAELRARPSLLALPAVTLGAGLAVYAYIPIAAGQSPPLVYNNPVTPEAFWWLVTGEQFRGQYGALLTPGSLGPFFGSLPDLWSLAWARATPVVPVAGLIGLAVLVRRRPAFGLACLAILVTGCYVWASYLRLEHYLLVPWLVLGIGVAVALDAATGAVEGRSRPGFVPLVAPTATLAGIILAAALVTMNLAASDRRRDRSADAYVDAVLGALPPAAAILTEWDASTPLWYAQLVEGRRADVLVVDDTNIVYEGWDTRERRIDALVCERPVFILRLDDDDLMPTRERYELVEEVPVRVASGGPVATETRPVWRVEPRPGQCP